MKKKPWRYHQYWNSKKKYPVIRRILFALLICEFILLSGKYAWDNFSVTFADTVEPVPAGAVYPDSGFKADFKNGVLEWYSFTDTVFDN